MDQSRELVLASTSAYRRQLLERLRLRFQCAAPGVNEAELEGEQPPATALRLAHEKAHAVITQHPNALIIGSDQVAEIDGERLGKPGTYEMAVKQLRRLSGRTARFHTAVCVLDALSGKALAKTVPCEVAFRQLSEGVIRNYLRIEQPYDCAGSAKSEGLGIALISRIDTQDSTALIGLPLIALTELLAQAGLPVIGG